MKIKENKSAQESLLTTPACKILTSSVYTKQQTDSPPTTFLKHIDTAEGKEAREIIKSCIKL